MSIVLPNSFSCMARSAFFDEAEPIDFRSLVPPGLPNEVSDQLVARRFLVTTSHVQSTVSAYHSIHFTETLVKIPVQMAGEDFLFPVVTYVDNEYSLIRGYLLGFNKVYASPTSDSGGLALVMPGLDLDLREKAGSRSENPDIPHEQQYPMLLWTEYSLGEHVSSHGFQRLTMENYVRHGLFGFDAARSTQQLVDREVEVSQLYGLHDRFVVTGTVPVAGREHAVG